MSANPHIYSAARSAAMDAICRTTVSTSAVLVLYAGNQPANCDTAVTAANTVVASLAFPSTNAFASAAAGVSTANTITADSSAAGGTAVWFSIQKSTGLRIYDGSVGTASADLILNATVIATGANVSISALTATLGA